MNEDTELAFFGEEQREALNAAIEAALQETPVEVEEEVAEVAEPLPASNEWEPTHLAFDDDSPEGRPVVGRLYVATGRMVFFDPNTRKKVKTKDVEFRAITAVKKLGKIELELDYDALCCIYSALHNGRGMSERIGGYSAWVKSFDDRLLEVFLPGHANPYIVTAPDKITVSARME